MKKCIWCSKSEESTTFTKAAHSFPKSLGGIHICDNVCDPCNHYFGAPTPSSPAIEVVFKELLNISKYLLLYQTTGVPKNKRFKSEYFNLNWKSRTFKIKPRYKLRKGFQEKLGRLFRRGMYKVFLEERERQIGDAHLSKFDFIREFARYNLNNCPVYIFQPKYPAVFSSNPDVISPVLRFTAKSEKEEKEFGVYSYQIMGHEFCIPISRYFEGFSLDRYKKYLKDIDCPMGTEIKTIQYAEDIDFTFRFLNDSH